jgi:hypothetical protein
MYRLARRRSGESDHSGTSACRRFGHGARHRACAHSQRPEADINVAFHANSTFVAQSEALAWPFEAANQKYASEYPIGR